MFYFDHSNSQGAGIDQGPCPVTGGVYARLTSTAAFPRR